MGKKGKKAQAGKPKKLTPKDVSKRLDALVKKLEEELEGADLFAPLPPTEDCPICLVPLSRRKEKSQYQSCCGNNICNACVEGTRAAIKKQNEKNAGKKDKPVIRESCPLCRAPVPSSVGEALRQCEERKMHNDHRALDALGSIFRNESYGQVQDNMKALDYFIQATEHGSPGSPSEIASFYREGDLIHVSQDMKRAALFTRVAAIRGSVEGRHNIGLMEYYDFGNHQVGIRHWKIAAEAGSQPSLNQLKRIYNANGKVHGKEFISKEDLDDLYRTCHEVQMEINTEERKKHWSLEDDKFRC